MPLRQERSQPYMHKVSSAKSFGTRAKQKQEVITMNEKEQEYNQASKEHKDALSSGKGE